MFHRPIKMADVQLTGTKREIFYTLAFLNFRGWLWESDKVYHPVGDGKFLYTLTNVTAPTEIRHTHPGHERDQVD